MLPSFLLPRFIWRETFVVDHAVSYTMDETGEIETQMVSQAFTFTGFEFAKWRLGLETALSF